MIKQKRIYEPKAAEDGYRILVDRIWPRGVSKEAAAIDLWLKDVAPSTDLRKWFNHEPARYEAFKEKYLTELKQGRGKEAYQTLQVLIKEHATVTLLYGAKDERFNQATVLREKLQKASQKTANQ